LADVFLSYKRDQRNQVERLATALRGLGLDVWFDASLSAGESFSDEIDREVRSARVIVVCWSPEAALSQWVKAEAHVGFGKRNLISTYIAGTSSFEPPVPFNSLHMEDLRAWADRPSLRDAEWLSVLRRMGTLTGRRDIADWGAIASLASVAQIETWLSEHGATSPLVVEAESLLRERQAVNREREAAEQAARERASRLRAEREAAQATQRAEQERAAAQAHRRDAQLGALRSERERTRAAEVQNWRDASSKTLMLSVAAGLIAMASLAVLFLLVAGNL
jgi:hypothetical protein